jgi:hypothetical protein
MEVFLKNHECEVLDAHGVDASGAVVGLQTLEHGTAPISSKRSAKLSQACPKTRARDLTDPPSAPHGGLAFSHAFMIRLLGKRFLPLSQNNKNILPQNPISRLARIVEFSSSNLAQVCNV